MRFAFHDAIARLNSLHRLDRIDDLELLRDRIKIVLSELDKDVKNYKRTRFGKRIIQWLPFSVGNIFVLGGIATGLITDNKLISATSAGIGVAFRFIDKAISPKEPDGNKDKLVRMLAGIRKDIIKSADVKNLI
jgi:hypothetical protein